MLNVTELSRTALLLFLFTLPINAQVPKVTGDLKPGISKARGTLTGGPLGTLSLNVTSTIKEENGFWVITVVTETPVVSSTETVTVEKGTLIVRKLAIQGSGDVNFEVSGNKITGIAKLGGLEIPISILTDSPLFAEGAGGPASVALLPLAEGYTTTYYNVDVGSQRVLPVRIRVVGSETVTVPAGTFDAFKIEFAAEDGTTESTLWVSKKERTPVKGQSILHTGAILTTELLP